MGTKWEFWGNGRPAVGGYGGDGPAVVLWWWVRQWVVLGVGGFGFREEKTGRGWSRAVLYGRRENEEWGEKGDLKAIYAGLKPSTFERTYVRSTVLVQVSVCCAAACVRTYASTFERTRAVQWVRAGATVELHQGKVERSAVHVRT
jgi:hypothetical protein